MVDLLIVTRDVWSLRFNQDYEAQQNSASLLHGLALGEQPLRLAQEPGRCVHHGPRRDVPSGPTTSIPTSWARASSCKRLSTGSGSARSARSRPGRSEGTSSHFHLEYPLWALARRWGAYRGLQHFRRRLPPVLRGNRASRIGPGWRSRRSATAAADVRPLPVGVPAAHHGTQLGGHPLISAAHPHPAHQPGLRAESGAAVILAGRFSLSPAGRRSARNSPRRSSPSRNAVSDLFLRYELFTPRYRTYRDLNTFDFREDIRLGPSLSLKAGRASTWSAPTRTSACFKLRSTLPQTGGAACRAWVARGKLAWRATR
jgi:hypothetical protein